MLVLQYELRECMDGCFSSQRRWGELRRLFFFFLNIIYCSVRDTRTPFFSQM